jgi:hypothetical protein
MLEGRKGDQVMQSPASCQPLVMPVTVVTASLISFLIVSVSAQSIIGVAVTAVTTKLSAAQTMATLPSLTQKESMLCLVHRRVQKLL